LSFLGYWPRFFLYYIRENLVLFWKPDATKWFITNWRIWQLAKFSPIHWCESLCFLSCISDAVGSIWWYNFTLESCLSHFCSFRVLMSASGWFGNWNGCTYLAAMQEWLSHFLKHMEGNFNFWRFFNKALRHVAWKKFRTNSLKEWEDDLIRKIKKKYIFFLLFFWALFGHNLVKQWVFPILFLPWTLYKETYWTHFGVEIFEILSISYLRWCLYFSYPRVVLLSLYLGCASSFIKIKVKSFSLGVS